MLIVDWSFTNRRRFPRSTGVIRYSIICMGIESCGKRLRRTVRDTLFATPSILLWPMIMPSSGSLSCRADQWSIENSNIFQGYFHILGGTISSVGQRKEDLLINSLVERVNRDNIEEVILATSATVEGQTTAYYIQDSLKNTNAKVTKLAQGLPVGGEIESLDDGTLFSAFKNRSNLNSNSD